MNFQTEWLQYDQMVAVVFSPLLTEVNLVHALYTANWCNGHMI